MLYAQRYKRKPDKLHGAQKHRCINKLTNTRTHTHTQACMNTHKAFLYVNMHTAPSGTVCIHSVPTTLKSLHNPVSVLLSLF